MSSAKASCAEGSSISFSHTCAPSLFGAFFGIIAPFARPGHLHSGDGFAGRKEVLIDTATFRFMPEAGARTAAELDPAGGSAGARLHDATVRAISPAIAATPRMPSSVTGSRTPRNLTTLREGKGC